MPAIDAWLTRCDSEGLESGFVGAGAGVMSDVVIFKMHAAFLQGMLLVKHFGFQLGGWVAAMESSMVVRLLQVQAPKVTRSS